MRKFLSNPVNLIFISIVIALLFYLVFAEKGLIKRVKLEIELKKLKKEIEKIENENASLREKIHKLETDPKEIERIAREKYGMAKEGEEVFIIKEK
ncbi:MAG: septum formation initiator family protein [Candidatus Kryptonium sp.]|nr:septum formation initiator family protein [Candidatus Kryptonium sp.]MDW8109928.1 septum formation initiator family protein [Candidatus Kryptonium sp.]